MKNLNKKELNTVAGGTTYNYVCEIKAGTLLDLGEIINTFTAEGMSVENSSEQNAAVDKSIKDMAENFNEANAGKMIMFCTKFPVAESQQITIA